MSDIFAVIIYGYDPLNAKKKMKIDNVDAFKKWLVTILVSK